MLGETEVQNQECSCLQSSVQKGSGELEETRKLFWPTLELIAGQNRSYNQEKAEGETKAEEKGKDGGNESL